MGARAFLLPAVAAISVAVACAAGSTGHSSYNPGGAGTGASAGAGGADASAGGSSGSGGGAASGGSGGGFVDASFDVASEGSSFDPDSGCATSTQTAQVDKLPVDIIWIVDNSVSMQPAVTAVTNGLNSFAQLIASKNLDYRVIMLSVRSKTSPITLNGGTRYPVCIPPPLAGDNNCGNGTRFFQSSIDIRSTQPLEQFLGTLAQTSGYQLGQSKGGEPWKQWLRPNATKTIVDVTDDNSRFTANQFETFPGGQDPFNSTMLPPGILDPSWNGLFDGYVFDALYGWGSDTDPTVRCTYSDGSHPPSSGQTYTDLVTKTGGVRAQICDSSRSWGPFFDAVAQAVVKASKISCELAIPTPEAGTLDPGKVNVQLDSQGNQQLLSNVKDASACGTSGGWYYDDPQNPTKVILCPASCDQAQQQVQTTGNASLNVVFGCTTVVK